MSKEKKSVLVGIYSLDRVGGAEMYTCDLIKQLKERNDVEIEFFAILQGQLCDYVRDELGVPFMSKNRYDLILATHNVTVDTLYKKGTIVQICHGAIVGLELPSIYADFHIGISKEICDSLDQKGFDNALVLNGLDLQQKQPKQRVNPQLKRVLSLCQSEQANVMLRNVCNKLGLEFFSFNKLKNPTFHIEQKINQADLVVGIGRSVYDAMACGRPCVVFDSRGYNGNKGDGYLHPHLFSSFVEANCSGRFRARRFSEEALIRELKKYNPKDGEQLRKIAEEELDVEKTTDALLDVNTYLSPKIRLKKRYRVFKVEFKRFRKAFKRRLKKAIGIRVDPDPVSIGMSRAQVNDALGIASANIVAAKEYEDGVIEVLEHHDHVSPTASGYDNFKTYWLYFFNDCLVERGKPPLDWEAYVERIYKQRHWFGRR